MSQLFLDKLLSLSVAENQKRLHHLENAIQKIASLQNKSGSFNYWDNDYYDTWSDIYAGDFMVEAHQADYLNDKKPVLDKWIKRQTTLASNWSLNASADTYSRNKDILFQAYRLYILAKSGHPAKSALNRFATTVSSAS